NFGICESVFVIFGAIWLPASAQLPSTGPDLIVGDLQDINYLSILNSDVDRAAIEVTTLSCNIGNQAVSWNELPNTKHPVITQNIYRLSNGVMKHIGQSGVKHGFYAINNSGLCPVHCTKSD